MSREPDDTVRRFLDGELPDEEERALLHRIADDPEARATLRFDARLRGALSGGRQPEPVPAGFTDRVMAAIEAIEAGSAAAAGALAAAAAADGRAAGRLAWLWDELTRPRTVVWRPAYAVAAAAALAGVVAVVSLGGVGGGGPGGTAASGTAADATAGPRSGPELAAAGARPGSPAAAVSDVVLVRFVFADPSAESVSVAGDFSRWEPIPLSRRERGEDQRLWSGLVAVPRGEHRYMFVVDGDRWVTDPLATAVRDDGFGNRNAILSL